MKSAIISGSTGFIGSRMVRFLLARGIKVIALGRIPFDKVDPLRMQKNENLTYIQIDMDNISKLYDYILKNNIEHEDCVFFHFAWGGKSGLSDMIVEDQMQNVIRTVSAFEVASKLNCSKFIHVGTMEEAFGDAYLKLDHHKNAEFNRHVIYAVAKSITRNALKAIAKSSKTQTIFVSKSHVFGPNDARDSLLRMTMKWIVNNEKLEFTSGEQNFDVISITDCVKGFYQIAIKGKNLSEYWIGSGHPRPLKDYINIMYTLHPSKYPPMFGVKNYCDLKLPLDAFSPELMNKETGFYCNQSFESAVEEMYVWFKDNKLVECNGDN